MHILTLIITNDGNGDQCGADYKSRCDAITEKGAMFWVGLAKEAARYDRKKHGNQYNAHDILTAALQSYEYYLQHINEGK